MKLPVVSERWHAQANGGLQVRDQFNVSFREKPPAAP